MSAINTTIYKPKQCQQCAKVVLEIPTQNMILARTS